MVVIQKPSYSWWFDSHNSPRQSPWLISTLSELDGKTKAMLELIDQDADSFTQRVELYYKKRPELVGMVEDFYRAHRSLAEQFDQLKTESRSRLTTPLGSPVSNKNWTLKLRLPTDKSSRTSSAASFDSEESEIDDPDEVQSQSGSNIRETVQVLDKNNNESADEMEEKLKKENESLKAQLAMKDEEKREEKLKKENESLKAQLAMKDEEKREVIRQLCLSIDIIKEENVELKRSIKDSKKRGGGGMFDFKKLGRLFPGGGHLKKAEHQHQTTTTTLLAL